MASSADSHQMKGLNSDGKDTNVSSEGGDNVDVNPPAGGFDAALELAGSWGPWQKKFFVYASTAQMFTAMHAIAAAFLGAPVDHWCRVPNVDHRDYNYTEEEFKNISIPWNGNEYSQCEYYDLNYTSLFENGNLGQHRMDLESNSTAIKSCSEFVFSTEVFESTVVSEWSLVCDRNWLAPTVQATYMGGLLVGSLIMGQLSDRFGRRTVSVLSSVISLICGLATGFASNYITFLCFRFLIAWMNAGVMVTNFVNIMEVVHPNARAATGMIYAVPYGVGIFVLPGISYLVRNWRYLQFVLCALFTWSLTHYWFLPESPRWLTSKGRYQEALDILKKIAKGNGRTLDDNQIVTLLRKEEGPDTANDTTVPQNACLGILIDQASLVKTPVMRRRCLICFYTWFVGAMVYYGLIFSGGNIEVDLFLMIFISGLVEIPSIFLVVFMLRSMGRRSVMFTLFLVCGIVCIIILLVPLEYSMINLVLANVGKFFNTAVFQLCYVYTAELVPTPVRNIAMGTSSMFGRVGSSIAPYIVDLLGEVHYAIPSTLFGILSIVAGLLTLLLPETANTPLPETISEVESKPK